MDTSQQQKQQSNSGTQYFPDLVPDTTEKSTQEEDVCRICRSEAETNRPLLHPCKCSGSIKFVHQDCLLQWLKHSGMKACEVCQHPFSFTNKYRDDAPLSLGILEVIKGLYLQARGAGEYFWRVFVCSSLWLILQPLVMASVWRLMLQWPLQGVRSILPGVPLSFTFLLELSQGALISIMLALLHVFSSQVLDSAYRLWESAENIASECVRDIVMEVLQKGELTPDECQRIIQQRQQQQSWQQPQQQPTQLSSGIDDREVRAEPNSTDNASNQGNVNDPELAEFLDDLSELSVVNSDDDSDDEQQFNIVRGPFQGDEEGEFDPQDVSIEEFIGLTGPMSNLVQNFAGLTMANAFMLFLILFIPLQIGRVHVYGTSYFLSFMGLSPGDPVGNSMVLFMETFFRKWSLWEWGQRIAEGWHPYVPFDLLRKLIVTTQEHSLFPNAQNLTALTLGYGTIVVLTIAGTIGYALWALLDTASINQLTYGQTLEIIKRFLTKLSTNIVGHAPQAILRLKLSVMFVIELGLFSYMVGYWIEIGALPLWGGDIRSNWEFWRQRPIFSGIAHWLMGLGYVLCFHTLIRSARRILKPTALTFLKDPESPDFDPWEEMKNEQILQTVWRLSTATTVHTISVFSSVHMPVRIAAYINPQIFPLRLSFSEPLLDLFLALGLFQVGAPALLPHLNLQAAIDSFMVNWLLIAGKFLRLQNYLLPNFYLPTELQQQEDEEEETGAGESIGENNAMDDIDDSVSLPQQQQQSVSYQRRILSFLGLLYSKFVGNSRSMRNNHRFYKRFKRLRLRIFVLANLWFVTVIAINTCIFLLPLTTGRLFGILIKHPQIADLHAFVAGILIISFFVFSVRIVAQHRLLPNFIQSASVAYDVFRKIAKVLVVMALWQGLVCYMTGFLVINTMEPLTGKLGSMFVGEPLKEISIGITTLIIVKKTALMRAQIWPQLRQVDNWENRLVQLNEQGWQNLDLIWSLRNLIVPAIKYVGNLVLIPFLATQLILRMQSIPLSVQKGVQEYAYALWVFSWFGVKSSGQVLRFGKWLHDTIRDELYLEDRLLNNLEDNTIQNDSVNGQIQN
eukprot:TRINITY_DN759_c2_g1_i1.p1 TRINITY_DN759_c2_g1~~TRINITY_DN759_c2_g1_i1.p1  ORF type:complete len:1077 (-),score=95.21 TRINITY_DN759_c2_g1_i1:494-3724(-)